MFNIYFVALLWTRSIYVGKGYPLPLEKVTLVLVTKNGANQGQVQSPAGPHVAYLPKNIVLQFQGVS